MAGGWYWTGENKVHDCDVLDVNGSLAYIEDLDTGERDWVRVEDVEPAAIDEWHEDNGQFGVGA